MKITLDLSPRRFLVSETAFTKHGNPYIRVKSGWREPDGRVSFKRSITIFPEYAATMLAELEPLVRLLDSTDPLPADAPTQAEWKTDRQKYCAYFPDRSGRRRALVVSIRVSKIGAAFFATSLYIFQGEGQKTLDFLKARCTELTEVSLIKSPKAGEESKVVAGFSEVEHSVPVPSAPSTFISSHIAETASSIEPAEHSEYDLSDFEVELLERFDNKNWATMVEEKCQLERALFMEFQDLEDRRRMLERLASVVGQMNDFCAIEQRADVLREEEY